MGQPTGLALPGEENGLLPKPENWWPTTFQALAYRQLSVTSLQVAQVYQTIANNGTRLTRGSSTATSTPTAASNSPQPSPGPESSAPRPPPPCARCWRTLAVRPTAPPRSGPPPATGWGRKRAPRGSAWSTDATPDTPPRSSGWHRRTTRTRCPSRVAGPQERPLRLGVGRPGVQLGDDLRPSAAVRKIHHRAPSPPTSLLNGRPKTRRRPSGSDFARPVWANPTIRATRLDREEGWLRASGVRGPSPSGHPRADLGTLHRVSARRSWPRASGGPTPQEPPRPRPMQMWVSGCPRSVAGFQSVAPVPDLHRTFIGFPGSAQPRPVRCWELRVRPSPLWAARRQWPNSTWVEGGRDGFGLHRRTRGRERRGPGEWGNRPGSPAPAHPTRSPFGRAGVASICTSVVLLLALVGSAVAAPDSDKKKVDAAVAGAGDDLATANAKVTAAIKALDEVRTLLPTARADLKAAEQQSAASAAADRQAQAELEQATAAAVRAEQERAEVEFQITDLQSRVGNLAREVYQNGAFADFDLLITAGSPAELSTGRRRSTPCRGSTIRRWPTWARFAPRLASRRPAWRSCVSRWTRRRWLRSP